jgi:hypothetical protein
MPLIRAIKSLCSGACHWVQEAYCALGQKVGEGLEDASDAMAERRYLATSRAEHPAAGHPPAHPAINLTEYRVINGHKHAN